MLANKLIPNTGLLKEVKLYKDNVYDSYYDDTTKHESKIVKLYKDVKQLDGSMKETYQPEEIFKILRSSGAYSGWIPEKKDRARLAYLYNIVRDLK